MESFRIGTFNVNGINIPTKRRAIFNNLRNHKLDFCFLQETHSAPTTVHLWQSEWGGHLLASSGRSNARGVAILVRRSLQYKLIRQLNDEEGRILLVEIDIRGVSYTLGSLYAPTQDRPQDQIRFLDELEEKLELLSGSNIILGGDFNCLLNQNLDRNLSTPPPGTANQFRNRIKAFLDDRGICDIWRLRHPNGRGFTFRRGSYASRLDYIFVSDHLSDRVSGTQIHQDPHSDHSMVLVEIRQQDRSRGPGLWRLDTSLLTDPSFTTQMADFLEAWESPPELSDARVKWEWLKFKIKDFVIGYQSKKKSLQAQTIKDLRKELQTLCARQDSEEDDQESTLMEIASVKRELKEVEEEKANKAMFRSKCKWARLGEKPTGYFLRLEKQRSKEKTLSNVIREDGQTISNPKDIMEECKLFYQNLYTEDPDSLTSIEEVDRVTQGLEHPTLSDISKEQMDAPYSIEELKKALSKMNTGKCPGTDGLPPEFYSTFWEQVSPHFLESLNHSLQEGRMSTEQRRGIITLIPKKEVDRRFIANWRPITLLNSDYKIFAKAIALRLQRHISPLIHPDQTGFMQRRCIGENIRIIEDSITSIQEVNKEGLVVALDFSKAFDSVRWDMIFTALRFFGFGETFIGTIEMLFTGIETAVLNDGNTSRFFTPSRGIRQGCCASPYLFNLVVEMLSIIIRNNDNIKGLQFHQAEVKLSQFADDLTCFLNDRTSLVHLLNSLQMFAGWSGLKVNTSKSQLLYPRGLQDGLSAVENIPVTDSAKILGIWFFTSQSKDTSWEKNFKVLLDKARHICATWTNRTLSIKGKVTVANSLVTSLFQYPCSYIYTPPELFKEFRSIISSFIWSNKKAKIAFSTMSLPIAEGELNLIDLEIRTQAALLQVLRRILAQPRMGAAAYLRTELEVEDLNEELRTKPLRIQRSIQNKPYYLSIFKIWHKFHSFQPTDETSIRQEALWGSRWITNSKGPLRNPLWAKKGILVVQDLAHATEGRLMSHIEVQDKYNVRVTFLDMLAIRLSVPLAWRQALSRDWVQPPIFPGGPLLLFSDQDPQDIRNLGPKKTYSLLLAARNIICTAFHRWTSRDHPAGVESREEWARVCKRVYITTKETKLQSLQFKILHAITPCRKYLRQIRIVQDEHCLQCGEVDDIDHFFFLCPVVQTFWNSITKWLSDQVNINLDSITPKEAILGMDGFSSAARITNFILLHFRFYVHRQKLFHSSKFEMTHWLAELRLRLRCMKENLQQEGKIRYFRSWEPLLKALS